MKTYVKRIHHKPTYEQVQDFYNLIKETRHTAVYSLAQSAGVEFETVNKYLLPLDSKSRRNVPAAVWRCWMIDFMQDN